MFQQQFHYLATKRVSCVLLFYISEVPESGLCHIMRASFQFLYAETRTIQLYMELLEQNVVLFS
jgi:hypothetical protein